MQCKNCESDINESTRFCPTCGTAVQQASVPQVQPASAKQRTMTRKVALILFPVALAAGIAIFVQYINPSVNSVIRDQPVVSTRTDYDSNFVTMATVTFREEQGDLVFSLEELKKHRLIRFEYTGGQTPRPVLAYIAPTGQLVTAISVSEHCGSTEFKIKDNKIYCAHCPSYWDMMTMEAYACCAKYFPDPIPSRVAGNEVHVPKVLVEKWAGRL